MFLDTSATDHDATLPTTAPPRPRTIPDVGAREAAEREALVVICFVCRSFRDEGGTWAPAHALLLGAERSALTHGLCPCCLERLYPETPGEATAS